MKVLITGGFGFIGGRLAQHLFEQNHEVFLGTRKMVESPDWLPHASVVQISWDSSIDMEKICDGIDVVIHTAGMNAHDCVVDPIAALNFNGVSTTRLLHAAVCQRVKRFIYLSTAHVYGSPLVGTITEKTCPVNLHPYATSHRAGEDTVRSSHQRGEIEGVVIRLSNAFGAPVHKDVNCWMLLANDLCLQAVTTHRMVLHSSGMQRRDFIALTDACRAIRYLLELPADKLGDGLFNVGGAWSPTILELSDALRERVAKKLRAGIELYRHHKEEGADNPLFDFCIDKFLQTGFELREDREAEMDILINFCLACFKEVVRKNEFQI